MIPKPLERLTHAPPFPKLHEYQLNGFANPLIGMKDNLTHSVQDITIWASDHCHTLAGGTPILGLDMYEHSYHIDFGAKPATYVDTFMAAIRWTNCDRLFQRILRKAGEAVGP